MPNNIPINNENIQQIAEKFLADKLSEKERTELKNKLEKDPDFAEDFKLSNCQ